MTGNILAMPSPSSVAAPDVHVVRQDERRFQQLTDNIDAVFYIHELDEARITYISPAYERVWQQPVADLYADMRSFMRDIHPDDLAVVEATLQGQLAGESADSRYRLVRKDGTICYIHDRSTFDQGPDGIGRRVIGFAEDVTVTTKARQLLAQNAKTFVKLVRDNPFGVLVVDQDFKLRHTSQGCEKLFAGVETLLGRDYADLLAQLWPEPFAADVTARFRHTLASGEPHVSHRTIQTRKDIDAVEAYDWRIDRIVMPDGSNGVVCYFYDLSERTALEASLKQALIDKDVLLREIDHRVRNSLSMVGALLSMQAGSSEGTDLKQALGHAASRVQAIARVHERLYKGRQLGVVEFGTYLEDICGDLRASLGHERVALALETIALDLSVDQAVPLGLIVNELVTNAFKHCGDGVVIITVSLAFKNALLTISVSDDGMGMPYDYDASSSKGLGMQIVQLLTQQLGGVLVSPQPGNAAHFLVTVPVGADAPRD